MGDNTTGVVVVAVILAFFALIFISAVYTSHAQNLACIEKTGAVCDQVRDLREPDLGRARERSDSRCREGN